MGRLMLSLQLAQSRMDSDTESSHVESDPESSGSEGDIPDLVPDLLVDCEELVEEEENEQEGELLPVVKWSPSKPFDPDSEEFWKMENVVYEAIRSPSPSPEASGGMALHIHSSGDEPETNDDRSPLNVILFQFTSRARSPPNPNSNGVNDSTDTRSIFMSVPVANEGSPAGSIIDLLDLNALFGGTGLPG